jgi:hypothetical protein
VQFQASLEKRFLIGALYVFGIFRTETVMQLPATKYSKDSNKNLQEAG